MSQLAGRDTLACGRAGAEGCTALPFDAAHLRALMIGSAEIGEIVMRALILRRVGLIDDGGAGAMLVGIPGTADVVLCRAFSPVTAIPFSVRRRRRPGRPRTDRAAGRSRRSCR